MNHHTAPDFIVVDDDIISNIICRKIIQNILPTSHVQSFTEPEEGITYLETVYGQPNVSDAILLLDINMPGMSGWEFLDSYEQFEHSIKKHLKIYIISSSINPLDRLRAGSNRNIIGYIKKPLTTEMVEGILVKL